MKWLFWSSLAALLYIYFGYPAFLWIRARFRPAPVQGCAFTPRLSIVMVVRNEAAVLARKLQNLFSLDYPPEGYEAVIVSDGSTDQTNEILQKHAGDSRLRIICKPASEGKASGLNDAVALASGEIILFTDARQLISPGAVSQLLRNFADPDVGCASGELMLGDPDQGESDRGLGLYWRVEKQIRELESASGSVVGATGAIYAIRRNLMVHLPAGTILDDVYIPMHVARQGFRVVFDPKAHAWDLPDLGTEREFARKVRTLSGNYQLLQLAPWLLSSVNPLRFEFVSHKLLRLLAPFALVGLFISSLLVPQTFYRAAFVAQLFFYALSGLALMKPAKGPLARAADAAWTFVVLNSAATVAFVNFVIGRKVAWGR